MSGICIRITKIIIIQLDLDVQGIVGSVDTNDSGNYYPFHSAIHALLFMLVHSPRPLVWLIIVDMLYLFCI